MLGRTRLHQATGSPLISGRTVLQRPLWRDWLVSVVISALIVSALVLLPASRDGVLVLGAWATAMSQWWSALWVAAALAIGALAGCVAAKAWGAMRYWIMGSVAGLGVGWIASVVLALVWLR